MAARYWVGGAGSWSSTTKWSTVSGGASGASVPTSADDVYIDLNSGIINAAQISIDIDATCNNLEIQPPLTNGYFVIVLTSNLTINGYLRTKVTQGNRRILIKSLEDNYRSTIFINSVYNASDIDFRDIVVKLSNSKKLSGTRLGNLHNNEGIAFENPKTVYYRLTTNDWMNDNAWSDTSTGTASHIYFPLPQDTIKFLNTGSLNSGGTLTLQVPYLGTLDTSLRTFTMTFTVNISRIDWCGNIINGTGITFAGTGQFRAVNQNTQTITSNNKAIPYIIVDNLYGTLYLSDAFVSASSTISVCSGTFDTNGYTVTIGYFYTSAKLFPKKIYFKNSTITCGSFYMSYTNDINRDCELYAGTSTLILTGIFYSTPSVTFNDVVLSTAGTSFNFSGGLTCNNFTIQPRTSGITRIYLVGSSNFVLKANSITHNNTLIYARVFFFGSNTVNTYNNRAIFNCSNINLKNCDFNSIEFTGGGQNTFVTNGGDAGSNIGISFPVAKTVYQVSGSSLSNGTWALTSGGTGSVNNMPLCQDTLIIDTASTTVTSLALTTSYTCIGSIEISKSLTFSTGVLYLTGNLRFNTTLTFSSSTSINFIGNGIQKLKGNTITIPGPIYFYNTGSVELESALFATSITSYSGKFDTKGYNVSSTNYGISPSTEWQATLSIENTTWSLTGSGTIWNLTPGYYSLNSINSSIVLTNNTTVARTMNLGSYNYNKITISGNSTSTTNISANTSMIGELVSNKTVAQTINFAGVVYLGKWSANGTSVNNYVTITGSGLTFIGVPPQFDYVTISTVGPLSTNSLVEWYVSGTCTGVGFGSYPLNRTAPPAPRTLYWVGGSGNWAVSTYGNWSLTSGGTGDQLPPSSIDNVVFDSNSFNSNYTVTITEGTARCANLTIQAPSSGTITLAGSASLKLVITGDISLPASGFTNSFLGGIQLAGTSNKTILSNNKSFASMDLFGYNLNTNLSDSLSITNTLTVYSGSLTTNGYNLSIKDFTTLPYTRSSLSFGNSTITCSGNFYLGGSSASIAKSTKFGGLQVNAGTSNILLTGAVSSISAPISVYDITQVLQTGTVSILNIFGGSIFNSINVTNRDVTPYGILNFYSNITTGSLNLGSATTSSNRLFVSSSQASSYRTGVIITCSSYSALSDCDFEGIILTGLPSNMVGTRLGDCGYNSGITFDTPKTVYFASTTTNWRGNSWSYTSGGAVDGSAFPLPQDTIIINNTFPTSGSSMTITSGRIGNLDLTNRTLPMTLTVATGANNHNTRVYGDWLNGSGITLAGTASTVLEFRTVKPISYILSNGKTFTTQVSITSLPDTVLKLSDAFYSSSTTSPSFKVFNGNFDSNGYNITSKAFNSTYKSSIKLNNSIITLSDSYYTIDFSLDSIIDAGTSHFILPAASSRTTRLSNHAFNKITFYLNTTTTSLLQSAPYIKELVLINDSYTRGIFSFNDGNTRIFTDTLTLTNSSTKRIDLRGYQYSYNYISEKSIVDNEVSYFDVNKVGIYNTNNKKWIINSTDTAISYLGFSYAIAAVIATNNYKFFMFF